MPVRNAKAWYTQDGKESKPAKANYTKGTPLGMKRAFILYMMQESMGTCDFAGYPPIWHMDADGKPIDPAALYTRMFNAATGLNKTVDEFITMAIRGTVLHRALQMRQCDRTRTDDIVDHTWMERPDSNGVVIDMLIGMQVWTCTAT
jgi:aldehyde:ferredoxin oxidoreductase